MALIARSVAALTRTAVPKAAAARAFGTFTDREKAMEARYFNEEDEKLLKVSTSEQTCDAGMLPGCQKGLEGIRFCRICSADLQPAHAIPK